MEAFWKYYIDINIFNLLLSLTVGLYAGLFWACIIFSTMGLGVGMLIYTLIKQNQYYMYYNLGWTKSKLNTSVCAVNLLVTLLVLLGFTIVQWMF